jgi:hypothetical protein
MFSLFSLSAVLETLGFGVDIGGTLLKFVCFEPVESLGNIDETKARNIKVINSATNPTTNINVITIAMTTASTITPSIMPIAFNKHM